MARTPLTLQPVVITGLAPTYASGDAANGHSFTGNVGDQFVHVKCTGGGACTVTITPGQKVKGLTVAPITVVVPATTGDRMIGPFDPSIFNQSDGTVWIDLSTATGVTLAVMTVPAP